MKFVSQSHDLSHAHTLIYHLPDGETIEIQLDGSAQFLEFGLEFCQVCDTSEIDGIIHFFPRGLA